VHREQRAAVRFVRAMQRLHEAQIVDVLRDVREQLGHPRAALAVLPNDHGDFSRLPVCANWIRGFANGNGLP
jgi:hypothetical protein